MRDGCQYSERTGSRGSTSDGPAFRCICVFHCREQAWTVVGRWMKQLIHVDHQVGERGPKHFYSRRLYPG